MKSKPGPWSVFYYAHKCHRIAPGSSTMPGCQRKHQACQITIPGTKDDNTCSQWFQESPVLGQCAMDKSRRQRVQPKYSIFNLPYVSKQFDFGNINALLHIISVAEKHNWKSSHWEYCSQTWKSRMYIVFWQGVGEVTRMRWVMRIFAGDVGQDLNIISKCRSTYKKMSW